MSFFPFAGIECSAYPEAAHRDARLFPPDAQTQINVVGCRTPRRLIVEGSAWQTTEILKKPAQNIVQWCTKNCATLGTENLLN
jgi:hypothetical protein